MLQAVALGNPEKISRAILGRQAQPRFLPLYSRKALSGPPNGYEGRISFHFGCSAAKSIDRKELKMASISKAKRLHTLICIIIPCFIAWAEEWPSYLTARVVNSSSGFHTSSSPGWGHEYTAFVYNTDDTRYAYATLESSYSGESYLTFPSHYTYKEGDHLISAPVRRFYFGNYMTSVPIDTLEIPNGVIEISNIYGNNLKKIIFPSSLKIATIYYAYGLREIQFSDGLKILKIGWGNSLESIQIPPSVEQLDLNSCSGLKELYVPDTVLSLITCGGCSALTNVVFNGSTWIHTWDFRNCTSLRNIELGDAVKGICKSHYNQYLASPFDGCPSIETAKFGKQISGVLIINLFKDCKYLRELKCIGNVTGFGNYDFYNCSSLTNLESAVPITSVGQYCFYNCQKLSNRVFDTSKCKTFGANACTRCYAFNGTLDLTSATSIGNYAFSECTNIKKLDYRNKMSTIPQYGFSSCTSLTNITLSANLKSIGNYAFYRCSQLNNVIIPENVTYIGTNSFQNCSSLKKVMFNGTPPSANSAFTSIASNAHGYYLPKHKREWLSVIGSDGKWNGLIMEEIAAPILTVSNASIPYDTLTLCWTYSNNDEVKYSLYRNTEKDFATATLVATGNAIAAGTYTESDFMTITPQISPLHYWIVAENQTTGEVTSDHVEARRRFLLSVGYSAFLTKNTPKWGHYNDASYFRSLCVNSGGFKDEYAHFRYNASATTEKLHEEMSWYSESTQPGDVFVFYISTHGGDYGNNRKACLATYDGVYYVDDLLRDVRNFPVGVAVINIIMSCHSFSLTGSVYVQDKITEWLSNCGFGQCLGNVAWITSCDAQESSYTYLDESNSRFGQSFIVNGFGEGCADAKLYGTKYGGVEPDGIITFGELFRYSHEFFKGLSDDLPSTVKAENESLLDRIVAGLKTYTPNWEQPDPPKNIIASQGLLIEK